MNDRNNWIAWGIFSVALIAVTGHSLWSLHLMQKLQVRTVSSSVHYGKVPEFSLTDEKGNSFDKLKLLGKVWIVDFIFTSCADECPRMTKIFLKLRRRLPERIHFLSITVDPARDTPQVLDGYARTYGADWHFLTGDSQTIEHIAKTIQISAETTEPVTHSSRFTLLDPRGEIFGTYDSSDQTALDRLVQDANFCAGRS